MIIRYINLLKTAMTSIIIKCDKSQTLLQISFKNRNFHCKPLI